MIYDYSPTLDKQTCTDYVDCGKCHDGIERFSWAKNDSNYLDIKLKMFNRESKDAAFRLKQNITMGEAVFNEFT